MALVRRARVSFVRLCGIIGVQAWSNRRTTHDMADKSREKFFDVFGMFVPFLCSMVVR